MFKLSDNVKFGMGTGLAVDAADFEVKFDGTDTTLHNRGGNLLITASGTGQIEFRGNITASNNISSSGTITATNGFGIINGGKF